MKDVANDQLTFGSIPAVVLDIVWPDASRLLQKAVDQLHDKYTIHDIYTGIEKGHLILWLVVDGTKPIAAMTTRKLQYPLRAALVIDWVGGARMKEWFDIAVPILENFARDNGCAHIESHGRKGWERWVKQHDWEVEYVTFRKELNNG